MTEQIREVTERLPILTSEYVRIVVEHLRQITEEALTSYNECDNVLAFSFSFLSKINANLLNQSLFHALHIRQAHYHLGKK